MQTQEDADLEAFRRLIIDRLGLHFEDYKLPELGRIFVEKMDDAGFKNPHEYMGFLSGLSTTRQEWSSLIERLTVRESYFFRNSEQFQAFADGALPALIAANSERRSLSLLSAGCASGEEPFTLAILLHERRKELAGWKIDIRAADINRKSLDMAEQGLYSNWSLRQVSPGVRKRYFRPEKDLFRLDPEIRKEVSFEALNLAAESPGFWSRGAFDAIFCRNVLMYFPQEIAARAVGRMSSSLAGGGFLFLGHAETLRGLSTEFDLVQSHNTFFYRRVRAAQDQRQTGAGAAREVRDAPAREAALAPAPSSSNAASNPASNTAWFDEIGRSSRRIASLAGDAGGRPRGKETPDAAPAPAAATSARPLSEAIRAIEEERFGDALAILESLQPPAGGDPEALLLRAVALANLGQPQAAQAILEALLAGDSLHPGVHYLLALCFENRGEIDRAIEHYHAAIHLDATFSLAHFHLGRLAKQSGDSRLAHDELRQAANRLLEEDDARIHLFGGGFCRKSLLKLCLAELARLEEVV